MAQYIDKAAAVAEIDEIIADETESIKCFERSRNVCEVTRSNARISVLTHLRSLFDTLEVKEVDLEDEIDKYVNTSENQGNPELREELSKCARYFYELGLNTKNIKWKPITEIPTEHWENNPAISPLYLVKCGSINGNPILGYTHYSYVSNSWMDCFHATEDGIWKVLEWTDEKNI
jgi:hypothetical protein